ncbi:MAG: 5-(carboxyamino)imidazole ribonucleotide synthase [Gammaproteobacteria bacterium]
MKVGIIGGGQLARMLAISGYPLGLDFVVLEPGKGACSTQLAEHICADYDDEKALAELAEKVDVVTYEFENVPARAVEFLADKCPVYPPAQALACARDRLNEKTMFRGLDIGTAEFATVDSLEDLQKAVVKIGLPSILKTRTLGYDGKGQQMLKEGTDLAAVWKDFNDAPAILESLVPFDREVSIIAVKNVSGEMAFYPIAENLHREGILRLSTSQTNDPVQALAEDYARRVLEKLDYVGVLAIEFFQLGDQLLANEMAPRVHNSGHWSIEGSICSQFENHIRAVIDQPLGSTKNVGFPSMVNLIGDLPDSNKILSIAGAHLHLYGKSPRAGRKVGHITVRGEDEKNRQDLLQQVHAHVSE